MKLKTGTTYWAAVNQAGPAWPRLAKNVACDVAIIGAGITGALVAHELVRNGFRVAILDRRPPGAGSTSASTGLLLYETDVSLAELARAHGPRSAARAYELGRRAIGELSRIVRSLRVDCGFRPRKCLYLASDRAGCAQLREEYRRKRRAGFAVRWIGRRQLRAEFGLRFPAALYSPGCGQIDAMHLTRALLEHHRRAGKLRVFHGARVVRLRSPTHGVSLRTSNRHTVRAKRVIVATGYEAAPFLEPGLVTLHSTYVIASQPLPAAQRWREDCLIWETARPYFYLRTTVDGRILMGGEDEPFADPARRDAQLGRKSRKLLQRFRAMFPQIPFETKYAWTGTFAETHDGLPFIGTKPGAPRVLYALGYGGNGITFSQIAATLLGRMCRGQEPRDARLFRFDRNGGGAMSKKHLNPEPLRKPSV